LDFIDHVPFDDPELAPLLLELSSKHFSDWMFAYKRQQIENDSKIIHANYHTLNLKEEKD
jgi:hypothetical protein